MRNVSLSFLLETEIIQAFRNAKNKKKHELNNNSTQKRRKDAHPKPEDPPKANEKLPTKKKVKLNAIYLINLICIQGIFKFCHFLLVFF